MQTVLNKKNILHVQNTTYLSYICRVWAQQYSLIEKRLRVENKMKIKPCIYYGI